MARCEDFPCCGHEPGCCPDFDESGRQLNMKCTCGAVLPLHSRYSICETCMNMPMDGDYPEEMDCPDPPEEEDYEEEDLYERYLDPAPDDDGDA